jgi:hypothetical protein
MGNQMLAQGKTKAQIEEELLFKERELRDKSGEPFVPEKVTLLVKKAGEKWMKINPPWMRRVASTAIVGTGIFFAGGHAATLGVGGYGLYMGQRGVRALAGGAIGHGLVKLKNIFKSVEKDVAKIDAAYKEQAATQEFGTKPLTLEALTAMQDITNEKIRAERNTRIKHMIVDGAIRIIAGVGVSGAMKFGAEHNWFGGHGSQNIPDATTPKDPSGATGTTGSTGITGTTGATGPTGPGVIHGPSPIPGNPDHHVYKDFKIEYSSKGAIQTWADVKHKLMEEYHVTSHDLNDPTKTADIPPKYLEIMKSRADALAKEFGGWRPDQANESLNVLKGSSIEFDSHGNVVSHSLRNLHGAVEDEKLLTTDATGASHDNVNSIEDMKHDENYFHYGQHAHDGTAVKPHLEGGDGTATKPDLDGSGTAIKPNLEGGTVAPANFLNPGNDQHFDYGNPTPGQEALNNSGISLDELPRHLRKAFMEGHRYTWWANHIRNYNNLHPHKVHLDLHDVKQHADGKFYYDFEKHHGNMGSDDLAAPVDGGGSPAHHVENIPSHPINPLETTLYAEQVEKLLHQPASELMHTSDGTLIDNDWLRAHPRDPLFALHKMLYDFTTHGHPPHIGESTEDYLRRISTEHTAFMNTNNVQEHPIMNPANPGGAPIGEQVVGRSDYFTSWEQRYPQAMAWMTRNRFINLG